MIKTTEDKKRTILESLNGHLQIQAVRLKNLDLETNILPENKILSKKILDNSSKKKVNTVIDMKRTYNSTPLSFAQTKRNKPKTRILKPYDPLYTWNRGGRLKELRIRCQARKYFYIWRNKSIGQVTDLRARSHYRLRLIRTAWNIWYQQYWQLRIEPRLFGRAILYRKSVVLRVGITAWHNWTQFQQQKRNKITRALQFHIDNVKRYIFNTWLSWIVAKKCKIKLNFIAQKHSNQIQLKSKFNIWKIAFQLKLELNIHMATAVSHHGNFLQKKYIHKWISERPILRHCKLSHEKAINHAQSNLLKVMWDRWTDYHHKYKLKMKEKERWNNHYNWNLAHRYLTEWKEQHRSHLVQSALRVKCKNLSTKFQQRKYFAKWRLHHENERNRLYNMKKAREMDNKLIKKHAWNQIKLYIDRRRVQKIMKENAQSISNRLVRQQYFDKWISRLEQKDDEKIQVENGAARSHYRRTMFMKYVNKWSQYTTMSLAIKERQKLAESFYENNLMKRTMKCWLAFVNISKYAKQLENFKENFIRKNVLIKYWIMWKIENEKHKSLAIQLNNYLETRKFDHKRHIFQKWFSLTNLKIKENSKNNQAIEHFKNKILSKHFFAILQYVKFQQLKKMNIDLAHIHLQHQIKQKIFSAWRAVCINKRKQTYLLISRFQKIKYDIKRIVFNRWIKYIKDKRLINSKVNEIYKEKGRELLSQTFTAWRHFILKRRSKKELSFKKMVDCKYKLDQINKRKVLNFWKNRALVILEESNKIKDADALFRHACMSTYFEAWKQYHQQQNIKCQQRQLSCWFWEKSEQIRVWFVWRRALADRQRENYYTRFALGHWSLNLQKKVFIVWNQYIIERRETIRKENEAFTEYQSRLKRYTIRQWLKSADFLIQWRSRHGKAISENSLTNNFVVKAVAQWKRFTQLRSKKINWSNESNLQKFPSELKHSKVNVFHKEISARTKIRPKPKIPEFLFYSDKKELGHFHSHFHPDDNNNNNKKKDKTETIHISSIQSDNGLGSEDLLLLPPTCFEHDSHRNGSVQTVAVSDKTNNLDLMQEINYIKGKLLHFKESKSILKNLEMELAEYDSVVIQLNNGGDGDGDGSSFYMEFDPLIYRDNMARSIEDVKLDLSRQKDVCLNLSKRLQEIMKNCSQ